MAGKRLIKYNTASIIDYSVQAQKEFEKDIDIVDLQEGYERVGRIMYWGQETYANDEMSEFRTMVVAFVEDQETGWIVKVEPTGIQMDAWKYEK